MTSPNLAPARRRVRIGLFWFSDTSGNLGVGALTVSQIDRLKKLFPASSYELIFTIFGNPGPLKYDVGAECNFFDASGFSLAKNFFSLVGRLRDQDFVIDIAEGDSFTDIYGIPRFLKIIFPRFVMTIFGVRWFLAPQTLGPFRHLWVAWLANLSLRGAAIVATRDKIWPPSVKSTATREVLVTADLAFGMQAERIKKMSRSIDYVTTGGASAAHHIGVNISGLLWQGEFNSQWNMELDYKSLSILLIDKLIAEYTVHLVPHVFGASCVADNDNHPLTYFSEKRSNPALLLHHQVASPQEAKKLVSQVDIFIGSRMHACIAAISQGIPTIAIAYSEKFHRLLSSTDGVLVLEAAKLTSDEILCQTQAFVEKWIGKRTDLASYERSLTEYDEAIVSLARSWAIDTGNAR